MKVPTHSLKYKNAHEVARSIILRIKSSIIVSCSDNPAIKDILRVWGILTIELKYYLWRVSVVGITDAALDDAQAFLLFKERLFGILAS
jgi:hypothetical protein